MGCRARIRARTRSCHGARSAQHHNHSRATTRCGSLGREPGNRKTRDGGPSRSNRLSRSPTHSFSSARTSLGARDFIHKTAGRSTTSGSGAAAAQVSCHRQRRCPWQASSGTLLKGRSAARPIAAPVHRYRRHASRDSSGQGRRGPCPCLPHNHARIRAARCRPGLGSGQLWRSSYRTCFSGKRHQPAPGNLET